MKKIALGALLAGLLVACGGSKNNNNNTADAAVIVTTDTPPAGSCDPIAQNCPTATDKCTWVRTVASQADQRGTLACVPAGAKKVDEACTYGAAGTSTGYDDCLKGLICLANSRADKATGKCSTICDTSALEGATGACPANYACGKYSKFFQNSGDPANTTGLCDPSCDPLTQERDIDKGTPAGAHCGGPLDANGDATKTCLGLPSSDQTPSSFTCGSVLDPTKTAGAIAYDATSGGVFLNSCAAGYIPLLYRDTAAAKAQDEMLVVCVAYCEPVPTSLESHPNPGGTVAHSCQKAGHTATNECQYWWTFENHDDTMPPTTPITKWTNGLGFCQDYTKYTYDGTKLPMPKSANEPHPSCTQLSHTGHTFDTTTTDDIFWGCGPLPTAFTAGPVHHANPALRPLLTASQMQGLMKSAD
jgi:hypothetical protein